MIKLWQSILRESEESLMGDQGLEELQFEIA